MARSIRRDDARVRGIVLIVGAMLLLVLMVAATKYLRTADYPPAQIVWARFFFHMALVPILVPLHRLPSVLRSRRLGLQVARSLMGLLAAVIFVVALRYVTIAEIVAITFMAPIFISLMAGPILGERVDRRIWLAVAVSFLGVLAIVKPDPAAVEWTALLPLLLALLYAFNQVIVRSVGNVDPPATTFAYFAVVGSVVSTLVVPFDWRTPDLAGWAALIGSGVIGGAGHLLMIRAYERAAASAVAPFLYTELLWAIAVGYVAFGDVLDPWSLAGAALIAGCSLLVLANERRGRPDGRAAV